MAGQVKIPSLPASSLRYYMFFTILKNPENISRVSTRFPTYLGKVVSKSFTEEFLGIPSETEFP